MLPYLYIYIYIYIYIHTHTHTHIHTHTNQFYKNNLKNIEHKINFTKFKQKKKERKYSKFNHYFVLVFPKMNQNQICLNFLSIRQK